MRRATLRPASDRPERFAAGVFGPVLFAFMVWLMRHPAMCRLDRLYFASREGWLLETIYNAMREQAGISGLPRGTYLHGSRRALLAAQMGAGSKVGKRQIDATLLTSSSPWFEGTVEALLQARIGFVPVRPAAADAARISLMRDAAVVHCVAELMAGEILPHVRQAHAGFMAYAEACGLLEAGHAGLVDVGYGATMQSAIQKTLGIGMVGFYMAATDAAHKVGAEGGYAFGAFAEGAAAASFGGEFGLLLEAMLSAPHGQVIGYTIPKRRRHSGRSEPLFDAGGASQREFPMLERLHAGVQAYCLERLATHGLQPLADPFDGLRRLGAGGIIVPLEVRAALFVEDAFCGNGEIDVPARVSS